VDASSGHVPVLRDEVLARLDPRPGETFLDGTAGEGGHAVALWGRLQPGGTLLVLDRDREALERLRARLGRPGGIRYFHANFCHFDQALAEAGLTRLDGAMLDLGISSAQLAEAERGFSFDRSGPLDMRFDRSQDLTAETIVNRWDEDRLAALFRDYGDQPMARRVARAIGEARRRQPLRRTDELADLVAAALPAAWRRAQRIHPATRVFQALRIAVNDELRSLETFLDRVFEHLKAGGRVAVIAFHSGEDRIVKHRFREAAQRGLIRPPAAKPITPTPQEVADNPRSRSARLRLAFRLRATGDV